MLDNIGGVSSPFCGWGYNSRYNHLLLHMTVAEAAAVAKGTDPDHPDPLNKVPFFDLGDSALQGLVGDDNGAFVNQPVSQTGLASYYQHNQKAQEHVSVRDWLLAEAFPATSLPMGANRFDVLETKNFDMSTSMKTSEALWPREKGALATKEWKHGDYKDVPYQHTFEFYKKIKSLTAN